MKQVEHFDSSDSLSTSDITFALKLALELQIELRDEDVEFMLSLGESDHAITYVQNLNPHSASK